MQRLGRRPDGEEEEQHRHGGAEVAAHRDLPDAARPVGHRDRRGQVDQLVELLARRRAAGDRCLEGDCGGRVVEALRNVGCDREADLAPDLLVGAAHDRDRRSPAGGHRSEPRGDHQRRVERAPVDPISRRGFAAHGDEPHAPVAGLAEGVDDPARHLRPIEVDHTNPKAARGRPTDQRVEQERHGERRRERGDHRGAVPEPAAQFGAGHDQRGRQVRGGAVRHGRSDSIPVSPAGRCRSGSGTPIPDRRGR